MINQYKCNQTHDLSVAFNRMKINATRSAMSENYRVHSLKNNLTKKVYVDLKRKLNSISQSQLQRAFNTWKINSS